MKGNDVFKQLQLPVVAYANRTHENNSIDNNIFRTILPALHMTSMEGT